MLISGCQSRVLHGIPTVRPNSLLSKTIQGTAGERTELRIFFRNVTAHMHCIWSTHNNIVLVSAQVPPGAFLYNRVNRNIFSKPAFIVTMKQTAIKQTHICHGSITLGTEYNYIREILVRQIVTVDSRYCVGLSYGPRHVAGRTTNQYCWNDKQVWRFL